MTKLHSAMMSRRGFCLCCAGAATLAATGTWLTPSEAFAQARAIVFFIKSDAVNAEISVTPPAARR